MTHGLPGEADSHPAERARPAPKFALIYGAGRFIIVVIRAPCLI